MKLIIVRHGHTVEHEKGIVRGQNHGTLSDLGLKQARKLAEYLKDYRIDAIYCSDLLRCKQTLEPLLIYLDSEVNYTNLLRERNYGIFNGKSKKYLDVWRNKNPHKNPEGGESIEAFESRIFEFIIKYLPNWMEKNVLIISHGGSIKIILKSLFKLFKKPKVIEGICPPGGISILYKDNLGNFGIENLYDNSYLADLK